MCNQYHYGLNCEMTHICKNNPCENDAKCMVHGELKENNYKCKCNFGYTGQHCTYPTCDLQPCKYESLCQMVNSTSYACNCTGTGHIGVNCETLINEMECHASACDNSTCDSNKCDCININCNDVNI